jgi:hypothetical protein
MKLIVAFPTLGRVEKAAKCIQTIRQCGFDMPEHDLFIKVIFSNPDEANIIGSMFGTAPNIICYVLKEQHVAPKMWNDLLLNETYDALCYLSDDLELDPGCLKNAMDCMRTNFPDLDGVIGLHMKNCPDSQRVQGAFGIIGREFACRFPNKQVFCPEYQKFCIDKELEIYAKSVGKFKYCKEAALVHHHPAFTKTPADKTHNYVRTFLHTDLCIFEERHKHGYIWGNSFEKVKA